MNVVRSVLEVEATLWSPDETAALAEAVRVVERLAKDRLAALDEADRRSGRQEGVVREWIAVESGARQSLITLDACTTPLVTVEQRQRARALIESHIAAARTVDDLVRVRTFIAELLRQDPTAAVRTFVKVVERSGELSPRGVDAHAVSCLGFRWWQLVNQITSRTPEGVARLGRRAARRSLGAAPCPDQGLAPGAVRRSDALPAQAGGPEPTSGSR